MMTLAEIKESIKEQLKDVPEPPAGMILRVKDWLSRADAVDDTKRRVVYD